MSKTIYKIKGFDCASCASLLEMDLEDAGIIAKCSYPKGQIEVVKNNDKEKIEKIVKDSGFEII